MSEQDDIRDRIIRELPGIIDRDDEARRAVMDIVHRATDDRFNRILDQLQASDRKWEANERKWEANARKWEANERKWEAYERRWEANQEVIGDIQQNIRANQDAIRETQAELREMRREIHQNQEAIQVTQQDIRRNQDAIRENQEGIRELVKSVRDLHRRFDTTIGALGARWGLFTEESFRIALKDILEERLPVKVEHVTEYDREGEVFGAPDQVEVDIVITDGELTIIEIKSSMSKGDVFLFQRKALFLEKLRGRRADRLIIISPMVDPKALDMARRLGMTVETRPENIEGRDLGISP